jgi:hypothetical protein
MSRGALTHKLVDLVVELVSFGLFIVCLQVFKDDGTDNGVNDYDDDEYECRLPLHRVVCVADSEMFYSNVDYQLSAGGHTVVY